MKEEYVIPEVGIIAISPAKCVLASGENLNQENYEGNGKTFWE